jgi:UDP-N-acetylmuramoylalanine--D-glutamate ligase
MKLIAILGAGESGMGAAMLAKVKGYAVFVSEFGKISAPNKAKLNELGIEFEEGGHTEKTILNADLIIKSPGISPKIPVVQQAFEEGIAVVDELEFAYRYSAGRVIAITGTNGKTTTTLLTYHLLKEAGYDVGIAGNVGESWAAQLVETDHEWWVIECSSYQIDGFFSFKPSIAVLTNITPDHLDRYEYRFENYLNSKLRLFKNMASNNCMIVNADDINSVQGIATIKSRATKHWFSLKEKPSAGGYLEGSNLDIIVKEQKLSIPLSALSILGEHNLMNALCAIIAVTLANVSEESIVKSLKTFKNAPHRMEVVLELAGVTYVNDSKGTNVESTAYALAAYSNPIIWIAGGVDKGNNYGLLQKYTSGIKALICLGKDNSKLKAAFAASIPEIRETESIEEAVNWGKSLGESGDVVLLSPACASFDLFKNYEDRGNQFRTAVLNLNPAIA